MRKDLSEEVKKAIEEEFRARLMLLVIKLAKELGVTKVCKEYNVPRSTFYCWEK